MVPSGPSVVKNGNQSRNVCAARNVQSEPVIETVMTDERWRQRNGLRRNLAMVNDGNQTVKCDVPSDNLWEFYGFNCSLQWFMMKVLECLLFSWFKKEVRCIDCSIVNREKCISCFRHGIASWNWTVYKMNTEALYVMIKNPLIKSHLSEIVNW